MKKTIEIILSLLLILTAFTACKGKQEKPEQPTPSNQTENIDNSGESASDEEKTRALIEVEEVQNDHIYEKYHYEGERTVGNEKQEYKFRLPQLKSTSSAAKEINNEIIGKYENLIKEQMECAQNSDMFYDNIYWQAHIYGDLLSLVIVDDNFAHYYKTYSVYLFDTKTEKAVPNSELLKIAGISENDFISKAKEKAEELFSEVDFGDMENAEEIRAERLEYMLSEDNISINTPMFIYDNGTLNAVVEIGQAGEADYKYEIIKIKKDHIKKYTLKTGAKIETDFITEKYSFEGTFRPYDDKSQPEEEYVLRLPQLKSSGDSAKNINKRIVDKYDEMIERAIESYESECSIWDKVNWESYLYNDILSIVITYADYMSESYRDYSVYNFNVKTEKEVTGAEILKAVGLSESDFIKKAKNAAEENFKSTNYYNPGITDAYAQCLKKTISDENITASLPMFFDDNGELNTVAVVYQTAGGELNHVILKIK
ncbi:MAG: hypothetical protein J1E34_04280 [Oscillospiraceae bacterium]|nr:hypothetical protein [Oscillospiraceae bacterium]